MLRYILVFGLSATIPLCACGGSGDTSPSGGSAGAGATGGNGSTSTASGGGGGTSSTTSSTGGAGGSSGFGTIFTIVLENTDYASIVGSADAPYINGLIAQGGLATNYMDSGSHPSLPNYLYMVSGDAQYPGVIDVDPTQGPYFPASGDNLGNQMQGAGIAWRSYQESMGTACKLSGAGTYAPKHDPFLYFDNIQNGANGLCASTNVDYSSFPADLAAGTYKYMWITPNLNDDGHDTDIHTADTWMSQEVPKILASAAYQANGILFVTWDEGEGTFQTTDHVPMIIVSPRIKSAGYQSAQAYTHASYLATVEDILGLPRLGAAMNAPTLMEFFQ